MAWKKGSERGTATRNEVMSRLRISKINSYKPPTCQECSVGTKDNPIPKSNKVYAEFRVFVGKHGDTALCRECAMQFAEDFANQLGVLTE